MREPIRDKERLEHICTAISNIEKGIVTYDFTTITNDPIIYFGFVKQIEIIGEATYMLTHEFRDAHPDTPWNQMEGMRHVLVHGYYAINPRLLEIVIKEDLPALKPQIEAYLKEFE